MGLANKWLAGWQSRPQADADYEGGAGGFFGIWVWRWMEGLARRLPEDLREGDDHHGGVITKSSASSGRDNEDHRLDGLAASSVKHHLGGGSSCPA